MNADPVSTLPARDNHREGPAFTMPSGGPWHWLATINQTADPEMDSINRALVAGLLLEVMLENPTLTEEPDSGRHQLKARLKKTLACHLAGRIPLASFHTLALGLDHWFEEVYPLLAEAGFTGIASVSSVSPLAAKGDVLREDLFCETLAKTPGLLPHRRHRKLDPDKLRHFLAGTGGEWFRLRDFERHFRVERKTAWEYIQKLLQAGLLVHNQGHSSAVRYRLAPRFLKPGWSSATDTVPRGTVGNPSH
ncbi:MAG: hypothetical protein ACUVXF_06910 [Desulfobaccales bacterium]